MTPWSDKFHSRFITRQVRRPRASMAMSNAVLQPEPALPPTNSRGVRRKPGLEIALVGVDGAGKTTVATALYGLTYPVKVIAMGSAHFRCLPMLQRFFPRFLLQLMIHCERMLRRWLGFCLKCFGWIVVYDRHPLEQVNTRPASLQHRVNNWFFHLYGWRVDLTFWLTGDYQKIYQRKREFTAERLRALDEGISDVLAYRHIDHLTVNVTDRSVEDVISAIVLQVSAQYEAGLQYQIEAPPAE